jgi:hypothetical protein
MARGGHGLPNVSLGPAMPYPSIPCGRATPETALRTFQWQPTRRAGGLPPLSTRLDIPRGTPLISDIFLQVATPFPSLFLQEAATFPESDRPFPSPIPLSPAAVRPFPICRCMPRSGHGLPKLSLGPAMPPFGHPAPHATPHRTPHHTPHADAPHSRIRRILGFHHVSR